jgi:23S rRNA pseudouridine2605 synthase
MYRLNQFIAKSGICSRRAAENLILSGKISVNGKVIQELGTKVDVTDIVKYQNKILTIQNYKYILLNKPQGFITTVNDEKNRPTVMSLIDGCCDERLFPVGRLDRDTMGLLLFTNDGELTQKITHPKYDIKKLYHIVLDKKIKSDHYEKIKSGIILEDGPIKVDQITILPNSFGNELGIEIHSGRNRIIRRIFSFFNYEVIKLDRVLLGPLTKKNLKRGRWRDLSEREIGILKMN